MKTVFIYSLNCPVSGQPRYVGKAENPGHRYWKHLCSREKNHRTCWIRSLTGDGRQPILEIIDEVPEENWQAIEAAYIQFYREEGFDLTNSTDGGDGLNNPSAETRAKISAAHLGKKWALGSHQSAEARAKISAANLGKKHSLATLAKMAAARQGRKLSITHRAAIGAARLGRKHSPESRAKMSAAKLRRDNMEKEVHYGPRN